MHSIPLKSPRLDFKRGCIDLTHGSGGKASVQLFEQLFFPAFNNPILAEREDQGRFVVPIGRLVMATDAHVVSPLFFPGGDIGCLSVHGTVNDIVMSGAQPLYLSVSFILEEGLPLLDLQRIVHSMAKAARQVGINIITGDTKVVEKGKGDGVYITTTGIGVIPSEVDFSTQYIQPGDHVLINGYVGDHGIAIMGLRQGLNFQTSIQSDTTPLQSLVNDMIASKAQIRCLRDPTRGGLATVLHEWASSARVGFYLEETHIPIRDSVLGVCELLGLDPLYVANEGKLLAICAPDSSKKLLAAMQAHPLGQHASIIGHVTADQNCFVQLKTEFGGTRVVDRLVGEPLPRIC